MRYVIETDCEHGEVTEHSTHTPQDAEAAFAAGDPDAVYTNLKFSCPGGSRRVVEPTLPNYEAGNQAIEPWATNLNDYGKSEMVREIVDAALAGLVVIPDLE